VKPSFLIALVAIFAGGLSAQAQPRFRAGENFTYVALECSGPHAGITPKIGALMAEVQKQNLMMEGDLLVVFHNFPGQVNAEELRWAVCVPVDASTVVKPPLSRGEYRYDRVAEYTHKGPYGSSAAAYPKLLEFIAGNGCEVCGPLCETYLDHPAAVKPEECRTLIVVPVKKKSQ